MSNCACFGKLGPTAVHSSTGCMRLGRPALPDMQQQCIAGSGTRCQCASCRAMRKQLWAVQPEEKHG